MNHELSSWEPNPNPMYLTWTGRKVWLKIIYLMFEECNASFQLNQPEEAYCLHKKQVKLFREVFSDLTNLSLRGRAILKCKYILIWRTCARCKRQGKKDNRSQGRWSLQETALNPTGKFENYSVLP